MDLSVTQSFDSQPSELVPRVPWLWPGTRGLSLGWIKSRLIQPVTATFWISGDHNSGAETTMDSYQMHSAGFGQACKLGYVASGGARGAHGSYWRTRGCRRRKQKDCPATLKLGIEVIKWFEATENTEAPLKKTAAMSRSVISAKRHGLRRFTCSPKNCEPAVIQEEIEQPGRFIYWSAGMKLTKDEPNSKSFWIEHHHSILEDLSLVHMDG